MISYRSFFLVLGFVVSAPLCAMDLSFRTSAAVKPDSTIININDARCDQGFWLSRKECKKQKKEYNKRCQFYCLAGCLGISTLVMLKLYIDLMRIVGPYALER